MNRPLQRSPQSYRSLAWLALAYTAFAIYGSLVPLDFKPRPWPDAVAAFENLRYLKLGIGSRADWVANILLFIPLTFLWTGTLWSRRLLLWNGLVCLMVAIAAAGLSAAIEFTQVYFPPRTQSINDLVAESLGAALGIVAWIAVGPRLVAGWRAWRGEGSGQFAWLGLLFGYLALLFGYNLLPLDLTLSPIEVYHKWREGRVVLIPFSYAFAQPAEAIYNLISDALIWVPVGFLWRLAATRSAVHIWLMACAAAFGLELLQLGVYSRVSDLTDVFTAALGAWLGVMGAARWTHRETPTTRGIGLLPLFLALIFSFALCAVFWFPFDFNTETTFIKARVHALLRAPFTAYYYGTEFRAVTEVLHKLGFFAPLGFLLGWLAAAAQPTRRRPLAYACACAWIALVAGVVEGGQLLLPKKNADLTDWVLECCGGLAGLWLSHYFGRREPLRPAAAPRAYRHLRNPR